MSLGNMIRTISLMLPGFHPTEITGVINLVYESLSREEWNKLKISHSLSLMGTYSDGTVSISASGSVTGSGTSFTSQMAGAFMRCYYEDSFFTISSVADSTHLSLSDWGGSSVTDQSYVIFKHRYSLPSTFSRVDDVVYQTPLVKKSLYDLNSLDPYRTCTSTSPLWWADAGYDSSNNLVIELYPVPSSSDVVVRCYGKQKVSLLASDSDEAILPEDLIISKALLDLVNIKAARYPNEHWGLLVPEYRSRYEEVYARCRNQDFDMGWSPQTVKQHPAGVPVSDDYWYNRDDI